jgi:hypothetical protein
VDKKGPMAKLFVQNSKLQSQVDHLQNICAQTTSIVNNLSQMVSSSIYTRNQVSEFKKTLAELRKSEIKSIENTELSLSLTPF